MFVITGCAQFFDSNKERLCYMNSQLAEYVERIALKIILKTLVWNQYI
jgi:hypothetical protein